jgi:hypothetical protein
MIVVAPSSKKMLAGRRKSGHRRQASGVGGVAGVAEYASEGFFIRNPRQASRWEIFAKLPDSLATELL